MTAILSLIILLFIIWIMLDLYLGRKSHKVHPPYELNQSKQSDIHLFTDGHRFFSQYFDDIQQAKHHLHICFFIFREDTLGNELIQLLEEKARQGVKVRILVDFLGSFGFKRKTIRRFKKKGIDFAFAAKPKFPYFFFSLNRRNHRKISVIDGRIGYFGGFNVGDEYLGKDPKFGFWQDYHLRVTGAGVHDIQQCFLHDWERSYGSKPKYDDTLFPELQKGASPMELIPTGGYTLEDLFLKHIDRAEDKIFIGTPYLVPSQKIMDALIAALERGVKMTIMLPFKKDHPFVKPISYKYIPPLLEHGAHIYQFYQGFYHAKVLTVDGNMCQIGTANFDMRSLFLNDEMNGFIYDTEIIDKIIGMTEEDINRSIEITLDQVRTRSIIQKGKTALSAILAPLL